MTPLPELKNNSFSGHILKAIGSMPVAFLFAFYAAATYYEERVAKAVYLWE